LTRPCQPSAACRLVRRTHAALGFASLGSTGHQLVQRPGSAHRIRLPPMDRQDLPGSAHRPPPIRFRRLSALELGTTLADSAGTPLVRRTKASLLRRPPFSDSCDRCLVPPMSRRYPRSDEHPV
jgi:hypothetical protein